MESTEPLKILPLAGLHQAAGARFVPFAGWSMPVSYPLGVMKEHLHTREKAGLFDISHMKHIDVHGAEAGALLARACPLDPDAIAAGASKYTFLLNDDAGILDDLIVTRLGPRRFRVVANAATAKSDIATLAALAGDFDCAVEPLDRVFLALQGPAAASVLADILPATAGMAFMSGIEPRPGWFVTRSGYTGEDGFEIALPVGEATDFAGQIATHPDVAWIGLGARDSLRLEAGLCLHGNDISPDIDPISAGLAWAIPKALRTGGGYVGAAALTQIAASGPRRRRVGLKPEGRQPVRGGAPLFGDDDEPAGIVTSGGFGPSVNAPVAMGYVPADSAAPGTRFHADVRGQRLPVVVHSLPFVPHRYARGIAK